MRVKSLITEAEYLGTSFDGPEPDFIDGEVVDRSIPSNSHSDTAQRLGDLFYEAQREGRLFRRPEIRIQVAPRRYRVVDLAIYSGAPPHGEIPHEVPFVTIEVVSPDDRYDEVMKKLLDYQRMGVPNIWLADPQLRRLYIYRDESLISQPALELPDYSISVSVAGLFD